MTESNHLLQLIQQGGWPLTSIIATSLFAWLLIIWVWLQIREQTRQPLPPIEQSISDLIQSNQTTSPSSSSSSTPSPTKHQNPHLVVKLLNSSILQTVHHRRSFEAQVMPLLRSEQTHFTRPLQLIATLAMTMPLLGLLGTVIGMTATFNGLSDQGVGQVDALADGISQALITTQAGLVVALPVVLAHSYLASRVRRYIEKSTTIIKRIETAICCDRPNQTASNAIN